MLKICFLYFVFFFSKLYSQEDWAVNPRKFVEKLAITASTAQIAVQDSIRQVSDIVHLKNQEYEKEKDPGKKNALKLELTDYNNSLAILKASLKEKINTSKRYKKLLSLEKDALLKEIAKELGDPTVTKADGFVQNEKRENSIISSVTKYEKQEVSIIQPYIHEHLSSDCVFQKNMNPESNKIALIPELLFTYTPEELKKHFKGNSYSTGYAFLYREPGYLLLQLTLEVASEQALDYYGNLGKSFLTIKLVNGKEVRLINSGYDQGKIDKYKKASVISGIFNIDKAAEKTLLSAELDTIKLSLVSGYEHYTIYNVDFFTRQLNCINSAK